MDFLSDTIAFLNISRAPSIFVNFNHEISYETVTVQKWAKKNQKFIVNFQYYQQATEKRKERQKIILSEILFFAKYAYA